MRSGSKSTAVDEQTALRALRLFNEKADKLDRLSFTRQVFSESIGLRLEINGSGMRWSRYGPNQEAIDAFCLTIRFFIQGKDRASFRSLGEVYAYLGEIGIVDPSIVHQFEDARGILDVLHRPIPDRPIIFKGHNYAPWEIFETLLYGKLSHANEEHERRYRQWETVPIILPIMEHAFVRTLAILIKLIDVIRPLNEQAIDAIESRMALHSSDTR